METERFDTVVIGAGQAGLSAAYYLQRAGRSFVILEGHGRVGDNWRERYDSLRLFTPAYGVSLPGFPYTKKGQACPTKDEMADYLERYAEHFGFPIRFGVRVTGLTREGDTYVVRTDDGSRLESANVIVASGAHRDPRVPALATELDPSIVQMHSTEYRNATQLPPGGVLVVGAGNSGADIALEVSRTHPTWISGPERGHIPADIDGWVSRHIAFHVVRFLGMHVLTIRTPMGRKARDKEFSQGTMLVRVKPKQIRAAGVTWIGKTTGATDGVPTTDDGQVLSEVTSVIWCTGYRHDLSWIDLPIFEEDGRPMHDRGVVPTEPGLAFVGLPFQFAAASDILPGVARDARYVVKRLLARMPTAAAFAADVSGSRSPTRRGPLRSSVARS